MAASVAAFTKEFLGLAVALPILKLSAAYMAAFAAESLPIGGRYEAGGVFGCGMVLN